MSDVKVGDLMVLKSGSMRMCVEELGEDGIVHMVWCNEGVIGRDKFHQSLLNKWEFRENDGNRGGDRGGNRGGGGKPYGGDRDGGGKPFRGGRDRDDDRGGRGRGPDRDRDDDRPPRKTGWDGKPRDKKFYRKDD